MIIITPSFLYLLSVSIAINYTHKGPTYFIATFLDEVHNWLVSGEIINTKSPLLYLNEISIYLSLQMFMDVNPRVTCFIYWSLLFKKV